MVIYLEKITERRNVFGTILSDLNICLMKSGRVRWHVAVEQKKTILYCSIKSRNSLSPSFSKSFRENFLTFITKQCINSESFFRLHSSHRMCNQFTLHYEFRIDTRKTEIWEKDNFGGSNEQRTQRSEQNWPECTACCMVPSEEVEETSKHCVLNRHQTHSKEKIHVPSKIARNRPLWHASSLWRPEGFRDDWSR